MNSIHRAIPPNNIVNITITGTGAKTQSVSGNLYTITFTGGTNAISFDKNITSMNVIVVGGGGGGENGNAGGAGGGGAGGGFGVWNFSYTSGTVYNVSVGVTAAPAQGTGASASFLSGGIGVTSTGGAGSLYPSNTSAVAGTCSKTGAASGTLTSRTGGNGGVVGANGSNSSGLITVLGIDYNYGGGGKGGMYDSPYYGGNAGSSGNGGIGNQTSKNGQSASTRGSGGGGGGKQSNAQAGNGGLGLVIVTFTYP